MLGWIGIVRAVECLACGRPLTPEGRPACRHFGKDACIGLTVEQGGILKPWCMLEHYEPLYWARNVWEWVRESPFDVVDARLDTEDKLP